MPQSVDAGNVTLTFEESGKGHPVLFVHGIPTDYRVWSSQISELAVSFRVISYSRRFAYPNKNDGNVVDSTVQRNSQELVALIEALKLPPLHLVGHSYGGYISLYTAWKHPELFRSLVLVEPAIPSMLVKNENSRLEALGFLLRNPAAAASARKMQTGPLKLALKAFETGDYKIAVKHFYDGIREKNGAFDVAPDQVRSMMLDNGKTIGELETEFPIFTSSDAKQINLPCLLIKGEISPKWLQAIVDYLAKSFPNNQRVQIKGSGHLPHIEQPSEFNAKLIEFLLKNDR